METPKCLEDWDNKRISPKQRRNCNKIMVYTITITPVTLNYSNVYVAYITWKV